MDTDMFSDIKLRKLIRCQGGKAVTVYVCLLCIIYEGGYYILWDEDLLFIVSERTGYEEAYIREVLRSCLAVGLFDRAMWADGVLTSRGIQCRYTEVSSRRKGSIKEYSLINAAETTINATETTINAAETTISATETPQRKVKERKENNTNDDNSARVRKREPPKTDAERLKGQVGESLLPESEWREAVWMKHGIRDEAEYRRLLDGFMQECDCNGKTSHTDANDLRSHFNSWLRIQRNDGGGAAPNRRKGKAKTAAAQVVAMPTEEELAEQEARKAEEERQRVLGIYEGAKNGNRRFVAIVGEWAKNGTLAEYGLEPIEKAKGGGGYEEQRQ